jgi:hypothetical protein
LIDDNGFYVRYPVDYSEDRNYQYQLRIVTNIHP